MKHALRYCVSPYLCDFSLTGCCLERVRVALEFGRFLRLRCYCTIKGSVKQSRNLASCQSCLQITFFLNDALIKNSLLHLCPSWVINSIVSFQKDLEIIPCLIKEALKWLS